jgi:hypothetical protein|tara:strand:- start:4410 stop:4778 length:369 start_codon:yes stop_codon:yes gene_type:complete
MELLQVATSGMDLNFDLGDLIVLGGILVPAIVGYTRLQNQAKVTSDNLKTLEDKVKDDVMHIQNGKRAIKKDLLLTIDKNHELVNKRIDKTQEKMEAFQSKNDAEFKAINEKLNRILGLLEK